MTAGPVYCPCGEPLHTKHCLAAVFKCKPRAIARLAKLGRIPSTMIPINGGSGEYRWTNDMVAAIVRQGEQWPTAHAAENEPKRQAAVKQPQPAPRRTRQPQPAPIPGSNVRPLVAKGPKRIGRAS